MEFTEKALVLKTGRFREADLWVRLLSPSRGVYTAFAFGGARSRRRFCGCLDGLNLALFKVGSNKSGSYLALEEASLLHGFRDLKADNRRLGAAANCMRFVEEVQSGDEGSRQAFDLLMDTLYTLETLDADHEAIPVLFRARMAFELGFGPEFRTCLKCGRPADSSGTPKFFVEKGVVACSVCAPGEGGGGEPPMPVAPGTLKTLEWIRTAPVSDWPRLSMPAPVRREAYRLIERFTAYHLGLSWEGGRFKKV